MGTNPGWSGQREQRMGCRKVEVRASDSSPPESGDDTASVSDCVRARSRVWKALTHQRILRKRGYRASLEVRQGWSLIASQCAGIVSRSLSSNPKCKISIVTHASRSPSRAVPMSRLDHHDRIHLVPALLRRKARDTGRIPIPLPTRPSQTLDLVSDDTSARAQIVDQDVAIASRRRDDGGRGGWVGVAPRGVKEHRGLD
jgi:hypothetical protein